jgi:hypothetical protein
MGRSCLVSARARQRNVAREAVNEPMNSRDVLLDANQRRQRRCQPAKGLELLVKTK